MTVQSYFSLGCAFVHDFSVFKGTEEQDEEVCIYICGFIQIWMHFEAVQSVAHTKFIWFVVLSSSELMNSVPSGWRPVFPLLIQHIRSD